MICPRCGREIPDTENICPNCLESIDTTIDFNIYRREGFVTLKEIKKPREDVVKHMAPHYYRVSDMKIFVMAIVFILTVSAATIFGLKGLIMLTTPDTVEPYETKETLAPTGTTEPTTIANEVKSFSAKDMLGSWKYEGAKDTKSTCIPYFSFSSDGIAQLNYGSMTYVGTFEDLSDKKRHRVNIRIDGSLSGTYDFDYTGNERDGYRLHLKNESTNSTFERDTAKTYKLEPINDYKIDKRVLGTWKNGNKEKIFTFCKDGSMRRKTGNLSIYGVWSVFTDDSIILKFMSKSVETTQLKYEFVKNQLIINDVIYNKVK